MKKIFDLMRIDLITMNGGKNNMKTLFIIMFIFFGGFGFAFSPIFGVFGALLIGGFFVPMMFQNEVKYHSEKLQTILPIKRRDLVNSRFILTIGLYTIVFLLFYFLMLLSLHFKPYYAVMGEDAEQLDIIALIVKNSGGAFTEFGLFNLLYFSVYAISGLMNCTSLLRKYFKNNESLNSSTTFNIKKADKKEMAFGLFILAVVAFIVLSITGIIPAFTALAPVRMVMLQLAQAANGLLLGAMEISFAVMWAFYHYFCTVLEYDDKEL